MLWLQQHQDTLTYRIEGNEDEGYLQESFSFLPDKIVERSELYGNGGQLLSANEQDCFYRDLQPIDDINSLEIDTLNNGKLCKIRLITQLTLMGENEEIQGNALFEFGFAPGDSAAKQRVLDAVKALMQLVPKKEPTVSTHPNAIRRDYRMLENTINRQKRKTNV